MLCNLVTRNNNGMCPIGQWQVLSNSKPSPKLGVDFTFPGNKNNNKNNKNKNPHPTFGRRDSPNIVKIRV